MKWIALAAVALVATGGGAAYVLLTRTTADVDLFGLNGWRARDGAREVDEPLPGQRLPARPRA